MTERNDSRPHLILLHAFPLHSGMWEPQVSGLMDIADIHAPDLPGFGASPGLDEESFMMDRVAAYVEAELKSRGIERCVIGGLSMGGYIAFECWRRFPERIAGLILADTRAGADSDEARRKRFESMEKISAGGYEQFTAEMVEKLLSEETRRDRPEIAESVRRMMHDSPADSAVAALLGLANRADSTPLLSTIDVPVAVIVGEHDAITPVDEARTMAEGIPNATLTIVRGAGHLSNLENPEEFNAAVREILDRVASEPARA